MYASAKLRDRDAIVTSEGIIFRVYGYNHPPNAMCATPNTSGVDVFGLLAYERGLRVTSSFLIGGTSTVVVLLVGFVVLHEPLTWGRLAAIGMIVGGTLLYQLQGR